ncbi:adenine nucleotide alpha-hydrolase family protein [Aeromonas simiae]|uniref:Uncharacterized protein n=1 Tax=Aeromonas simiae TaxID=218936 RepID=A0A5J6WW98_9GAMM|nr:hypothetical protein [Aeromonas simiae]QFI55469.1 hypothetical protein FE240_12690 [Aeromonas simiae]
MSNNIIPLHQGRDHATREREKQLLAVMRERGPLLVSFSGRMESCYTVELCRQAGVTIQAITVDNPTLPRRDVSRAKRYCAHYGIPHLVVQSDEVLYFSSHGREKHDPLNPIEKVLRIRSEHPEWSKWPLLVPGSIDDLALYRHFFGEPSLDSWWLFAEAGMTTRDFCYGFHQHRLGVWGSNEPDCLSLRFSCDEEIDGDRLRMVDLAEQMLKDLGMPDARVFFHTLADRQTLLCRVRLPDSERAMAFDRQHELMSALQMCGFDLVTLDLHRIDDSPELGVL